MVGHYKRKGGGEVIKLGNKLEDEELLTYGHSVTRPDHVSHFLK